MTLGKKHKKPHRHTYGGFVTKATGAVDLMCAACGESYTPMGRFLIRPIGAPPFTDCPHPVFREVRFANDDPLIRECAACGERERFINVVCVGGPYDGELHPERMATLAKEVGWGARFMFTSTGQPQNEDGSTTCFSYLLKWDAQGMPYWDGRPSRSGDVGGPTPRGLLEFEQAYAARSGTTVEALHAWGRFGELCKCGDAGCEGFRMGHQWEDAIIEDSARAAGGA